METLHSIISWLTNNWVWTVPTIVTVIGSPIGEIVFMFGFDMPLFSKASTMNMLFGETACMYIQAGIILIPATIFAFFGGICFFLGAILSGCDNFLSFLKKIIEMFGRLK